MSHQPSPKQSSAPAGGRVECSIEHCKDPAHSRSWCRKHYTRWQRHGDPNVVKLPVPVEPRFLSMVDKRLDGCWHWTAHRDVAGYGRFKLEDRDQLAHLVAYRLFVGEVPDGLHLDHLCHTHSDCPGGPTCLHRRCVNPAHLEAVTPRENTLRGKTIAAAFAARTHCALGHELSGENIRPGKNGARICRACEPVRRERSNARKAAS